MKVTLSKKQARKLALNSQGLFKKNSFGKGKAATLKAIEQIGYVQIDTISVVERAHNHTLWARVPTYKHTYLDELQTPDRKIFEYWSHAAAYLPISDYRYCLPRMHAIANGEKHWYKPDRKMMQRCLDRVKSDGPLMAKDFEPPKDHKGGPWWNWKPAKKALEQLFIEGKLMVVCRPGFRKLYDLPERVLPASVDTSFPADEEYARFLINKAIKAHGLISEVEICYQRKNIRALVKAELKKMSSDGEIAEVSVEDLPQTYYANPEEVERANRIRSGRNVFILSPFDNSVIQRKRTQQIFDFDYQVECYVPAPKRKFGYFCLPILFGDQFIGRMDAKADRKAKTLIVKNIYIEKPAIDIEQFSNVLAMEVAVFAGFNSCESVVVRNVDPENLKPKLIELLK